jgi:hypothetical protein
VQVGVHRGQRDQERRVHGGEQRGHRAGLGQGGVQGGGAAVQGRCRWCPGEREAAAAELVAQLLGVGRQVAVRAELDGYVAGAGGLVEEAVPGHLLLGRRGTRRPRSRGRCPGGGWPGSGSWDRSCRLLLGGKGAGKGRSSWRRREQRPTVMRRLRLGGMTAAPLAALLSWGCDGVVIPSVLPEEISRPHAGLGVGVLDHPAAGREPILDQSLLRRRRHAPSRSSITSGRLPPDTLRSRGRVVVNSAGPSSVGKTTWNLPDGGELASGCRG